MFKKISVLALAACSISAFAQSTTPTDPSTQNVYGRTLTDLRKEIRPVLNDINATDAYVIREFLDRLPGNYELVMLKAMLGNSQPAMMANQRMMMRMNGTTMGGSMMMNDMNSYSEPMRNYMMMKAPRSINYYQALDILSSNLGVDEKGELASLFAYRARNYNSAPTVMNERVLDAIVHLLEYNASLADNMNRYPSLRPRMSTMSQ